MAFDAMPGGDPRGPWCKACTLPIGHNDQIIHVTVKSDPDMSGPYHGACGGPINELARALELISSWRR